MLFDGRVLIRLNIDKKNQFNVFKVILGTGTLVESIVEIKDSEESKIAMLLNIKKLDDNFTKRV
ncbi:hypothetical protein CRU92_11745 [Arcobacter sp. FW59]|nr:hypothetical protein CRU92_11745 [Arcobacter sp. FW59]